MMPKDDFEFAKAEADDMGDHMMTHMWDPEREIGNLYAKTLNLGCPSGTASKCEQNLL